MKARLALIVAALQVLMLAFMAGQREWISRTGTPIILRTAPIDPNDPMRGAYVRLNYEINHVPAALCRGAIPDWLKTGTDYRQQQALRDRVVFASLQVDASGLAELISLSDTPPAAGLFLRGRVQNAVVGTTQTITALQVRYGAEALFMQKDAAQKMESMARKERAGAPINARIAVGSTGICVLKTYEWEPLGLTLVFDRPPTQQRATLNRQQQLPTGLTVTLHNYGDHDVAIVDLPDAQSFRLVPNLLAGSAHYAWVGANQTSHRTPRAEDVIVLKPGATHQVRLDLTQPMWWITDTNKPGSAPMPLQKVTDGWLASFRIEYAPPTAEVVRALPHADLVRHVPVRSRAFNANQGVD